jgi:beta-lactamase superfamily II metal-dependent hydrolase
MRYRRSIALGLALALGMAGHAGAQTLRIYHIDVDQAAATLFVAPGGRTLLVDSGKNGHGSRIRAILQLAGVTRIDHFVATHYHEDHYGGIDEVVAAGIPIGTAHDRGDKAFLPPEKLTDDDTYRDYDTAVGHSAHHLTRGETIDLDPLMTVTCISSGGVVLGENDPPQPGGEENDMSIGLLITFRGFRYWVGGDTETPTEVKIAARDLVQDVDVYLAHHHGADNGSSAGLLGDLRPSVIIISNGSNQRFKHPRRSTLTRMRDLAPAPAIFQLNKYLGNDTVAANVGADSIADPETTQADGTILVTVDQNAQSYTLSYGARTSTFAVKNVGPAPPAPGGVVITRLLPDPVAGPDRTAERVTLRNAGASPADLSAGFLRDAGQRVWSLAGLGTLAGGNSATITREGMAMSLDNDGDTVVLIDGTGQVIDSVTYSASQPGVEIVTGH